MSTTKEKSEVEEVQEVKKEKKPEIKFRRATVHDTMAVKELLEMFHEEFLNDMDLRMDKVIFNKIAKSGLLATTWVAAMPDEVIPAKYEEVIGEDGKKKLVKIAAEDIKYGKVVGVFCGYFTNYILDDSKMFHELVWYVHPEHRKCGLKLYKHCEEAIRNQGAEKIVMIHMATAKSEGLAKLYEGMGFKPLESHYYKPL